MTQHLIDSKRSDKAQFTFTHTTGADVEGIAKLRGCSDATIIREAVAGYAYKVNADTLRKRQARLLEGPVHYFTAKFGPAMASTIRARSVFLHTTASAFVEACCLLYLQAFELTDRAPE